MYRGKTRRLRKIDEPKKLFRIGTVVDIVVPASNRAGYAPIVGARGHVVSKSEWTNQGRELPTNADYVIVKMLETPGDTDGRLDSFNQVFPVRRFWLKDTGIFVCDCDIIDMMRYGCKCGGI